MLLQVQIFCAFFVPLLILNADMMLKNTLKYF